MFIKQQLSSLLFVKDICETRITRLRDGLEEADLFFPGVSSFVCNGGGGYGGLSLYCIFTIKPPVSNFHDTLGICVCVHALV